MKSPESPKVLEGRIESVFKRHKVVLTMGGEPTYVPTDPVGHEWSITALGPTKVRYAYTLIDALIAHGFPHAIPVYSPGKLYPGEVNPRWTIHLVWRKDGQPLIPPHAAPQKHAAGPVKALAEAFLKALLRSLQLRAGYFGGIDPHNRRRPVYILPLDHNGKRFISQKWNLGPNVELLGAEGPAGLRLPLQDLPERLSRRALTLEVMEGELHLFLPPLLQGPFTELLGHVGAAALRTQCKIPVLSGYVPSDEAGVWVKLGVASDPGVLEINLPPCLTWSAYDQWMKVLQTAAAAAGLRSFKQIAPDEQAGTGGGNHLVFGGPSPEQNALFTHPKWITSILRYWQHHPSLSYLFTGHYVGASSQAPRPDESASALYDLEMAYQFLEQLGPGDHRHMLSDTLRHLHTDSTGNTHRSEISFDKFWNVSFEGGCRGLIEFRAIESFPHAEWMSEIALLWRALAAMLLEKPFTKPLLDHGDQLHDRYFLPSYLWTDFKSVLSDLRRTGFPLQESVFKTMVDWRFPRMLDHRDSGASLTVRKAHEGWPLLCETPLEGGNTSRFVDTSIERLEFLANPEFARTFQIHVQGRKLALENFGPGRFGVGLRYRRSALNPSLHPGMPPQMPLEILLSGKGERILYTLGHNQRMFARSDQRAPVPARNAPACKKLKATLLTCDLRLG